MKIGVLALGRATFDIEFANQKLSECISFLNKTSNSIIGGDEILLESDTTQNEAERLQNENVDFVVIKKFNRKYKSIFGRRESVFEPGGYYQAESIDNYKI